MLISDLAMRELQWQRDSLSSSFADMLARLIRPLTTLGRRGALAESPSGRSFPSRQVSHEAIAQIVDDGSPPSRQLDDRVSMPTVRLTSTVRHAHLAAVRGLFNARSGDYEAARLAFAEAARDHGEDLTALPGFWSLPPSGQTAAVLAYEDVGRQRDAYSLTVQLRALPAPLAPRQADDRVLRLEQRRAASGD